MITINSESEKEFKAVAKAPQEKPEPMGRSTYSINTGDEFEVLLGRPMTKQSMSVIKTNSMIKA
jgi:hypothetical protein